MGARWAKLEADMAHFVEGGYINWNLMKWLDPQKQEVWELKSVRPKPSLRVFGRFAEPNVFVGTHHQVRNKMKGKWSQEFWDEIVKCETIWADLFKSDGSGAAPDPDLREIANMVGMQMGCKISRDVLMRNFQRGEIRLRA